MRVHCEDLERILREQEPAELAALESHAQECNACRSELEAWSEISVAARSLQRREEDPRLWASIRTRLREEARAEEERRARWSFTEVWQGLRFHWKLAAATVAVLLLLVVNFKVWTQFGGMQTAHAPGNDATVGQVLITDKALKEAQAAEAAYLQSIEKLAVLAEPKLQKADTPLAANYREKLLLLDAAISECRKQADGNKYNAHLQRELTSLYQEKKQTLEAIVRED